MSRMTQSQRAQALLEHLRQSEDQFDSDAWWRSLDERKRIESQFHDQLRQSNAPAPSHERGNKKFYDTAELAFQWSEKWIRENSPENIVLDYACGSGGSTFAAATAGAKLAVGIDVSPQSIMNCRREADVRGLASRTHFAVADCENTGFPDESVDRIICIGCLHHLDLTKAFPEIRRILTPGGRVFALEALAYNPLISLYRKLTPELRTEWEKDHILSLRELRLARHFFSVESVRYFHLTSVLTTPLRGTPLFRPLLNLANVIDTFVLRIPPISLLAWTFSFELVKPAA